MSAVKLALTEHSLGSEGWRTLQRLIRQRRRSPIDQTTLCILFALDHARRGESIELDEHTLRALGVYLDDELEGVA